MTPNNGKFEKNEKIQNYEKSPNCLFSVLRFFHQKSKKNKFWGILRKMEISILEMFENVVFCMFEGCVRGFTTIKNVKTLRRSVGYHS